LIIKNGKAALPGGDDFIQSDILIKGEKIDTVAPALSVPGGADIIDAQGCYVLPGGIDPHVHFDDPGYTDREDFYHGSATAASGGITTVIDMPDTTVPPVICAENLEQKLSVIEKRSVVDFGLYGGVSGQSFEQGFPGWMEELADSVLGFKTYFISGMEEFNRLDHYRFKLVLQTAAELDIPVLLHAEDFEYVTAATEAARREGKDPINYYGSRPETAEILAVLIADELVRETGARVHIVHIGSADAAVLLGRGRLSGETGPHYLEFDLEDFTRIGAPLKCTPPVKSAGNRERLWRFLEEGVIRFVASDHAPCTEHEKNTGSIWTDYAGMPGSGMLFPYMFSKGYMEGRIGLRRLLEVTSGNAARFYGMFDRKGSIAPGKDADLVVIDPLQDWVVRGADFFSKGKITPFEGMTFRGRVKYTVVRGRVVYADGEGILVDPGYGKNIRRRGLR
jgi:allantoinase